MPRFTISVPEVHRRNITLEAASFDEACSAILNGGSEDDDDLDSGPAEFSSTIDPGDAEWMLLRVES